MKNNITAWKQKLYLKDRTGRVLTTHEWTCAEDDDTNVDGLSDALFKIRENCASLASVIDDDESYDEIFDTLVIDHEPWTGYGFTIELDPVGRL